MGRGGRVRRAPPHAGKGAAWSGERTSRASPLAGERGPCERSRWARAGHACAGRPPRGCRSASDGSCVGSLEVLYLAERRWVDGGGAFGGCAHARQPGPCPDRERSRLPQVSSPRATRPLPSPGVPERLCGPDEGRLAGGECDPPSVRKPSLAIREACLGVPDPPACRLSLRCGSAAVATRLQRALPRCSPLDGMRLGKR